MSYKSAILVGKRISFYHEIKGKEVVSWKKKKIKTKLYHENKKEKLYHGKRAKRWKFDTMMGIEGVLAHGIYVVRDDRMKSRS